MKKIASVVLGVVLLVSCHHGDTSRPKEISTTEDSTRVEASRREVTAPMPSSDSYIPPIPKKEADKCDTMKPKGGQDMILAFSISPIFMEDLDNKARMQVVSKSADFQTYLGVIAKEIPAGTGYFNTSACYIKLDETYYSTAKEKYGLILQKADGTCKIVPGVRTADEWREIISDFFNGK